MITDEVGIRAVRPSGGPNRPEARSLPSRIPWPAEAEPLKMRSMNYKKIPMGLNKKIALVAHDNKKRDLVEWSKFNRDLLAHHKVYATGTTGALLEKELKFKILRLESGPLGGDQQIGSKIVEGDIDFLIFFWDPLEPQPHDPDVKALLRMAVVWNIPIACDRATADFMISSPLMDAAYERLVPDYAFYRNRPVPEEPAAP